jgi:uncharacterized protein (DUF362 family)
VFVRFLASAIALASFVHAAGPATPAAVPAPGMPPATAPESGVIWYATEASAIDRLVENPSVSRRMVDQLVCAVAGESDVSRAWKKWVTPKDRVGIKVNAAGGQAFATRPGVVHAVIEGLKGAGVPAANIVVWDRDPEELSEAGFTTKKIGSKVLSIDPPKGWDRTSVFAAPVLGKLIWGDLLFIEKNRKSLGKQVNDTDQLSSNSHFATILTRNVTKIVNIATLTDEAGCGVAGAFYNLGVRNVDNWRRFVSSDGEASDSIPELLADPVVGPKVVLHLVDGLIAQYAGGPGGNPNYAFAHATIYASRDPVALDATSSRLIEGWRKEAKLPSIARKVTWLAVAEQLQLGVADENRIKLLPVTPR